MSVSNTTMQALLAKTTGDWKDILQFHTIPKCTIVDENDVLIRVAYADLNPVDLQKLRQPKQAIPSGCENKIPGYSGSGVVEAVGSAVSSEFVVGDRVAFLADPTRAGSYAEYIVVHEHAVTRIPDTVSFEHAAIVPLAGCTAYESLKKLQTSFPPQNLSSSTLLIVGGAGGVGSWAIQLARAWYPNNMDIVCTISSEKSRQWCLNMGANRCIEHDAIGQELQGSSVDWILCLTEPQSDLFQQLAQVIRPYGSICLVVSGQSIQSLDLSFCFFKSVSIVTTTVFCCFRTNLTVIRPQIAISEILALVESQRCQAPLTRTQTWKNIFDPDSILENLASGHTQGKFALQIEHTSP
jgi:NADPH:quinone reductase-like Zn-dependent oxidoreductase